MNSFANNLFDKTTKGASRSNRAYSLVLLLQGRHDSPIKDGSGLGGKGWRWSDPLGVQKNSAMFVQVPVFILARSFKWIIEDRLVQQRSCWKTNAKQNLFPKRKKFWHWTFTLLVRHSFIQTHQWIWMSVLQTVKCGFIAVRYGFFRGQNTTCSTYVAIL